MNENGPFSLLDALTSQEGFYAAIYCTYGVDLAFFEEAILRPLRHKGCRNHLIFVDAVRYADTTNQFRASVFAAGRQYILVPIHLGHAFQSFHPKLILLVGPERGRLLIGSGNLTFTGVGHNHELFTCLDWRPDQPELSALFTQAWQFIKRLQQYGPSRAAAGVIKKIEYMANWLSEPGGQNGQLQFWHTLDTSLLEQLGRFLGEQKVNRITVVAPFLDKEAEALQQLHLRLRPNEMRLVLQDATVVGDAGALQQLFESGVPLQLYRFPDSQRYLHAKAYLLETETRHYVLTGSPNCTRAALLSTAATGNIETAALYDAETPDQLSYLLADCLQDRNKVTLEQIRVRPISLLPTGNQTGTHDSSVFLHDVSVAKGYIYLQLTLRTLPAEAERLALSLSTVPRHILRLGDFNSVGFRECQLLINGELQEVMSRNEPLSAFLQVVTADGNPVNIRSNEVWLMLEDTLQAEAQRIAANLGKAGSLLTDMLIASDNEWHDVYLALNILIEQEIDRISRHGGRYPAKTRRPDTTEQDEEEGETRIILVTEQEEAFDDIGTVVALENELHTFVLDYLRGRLPGQERPAADREAPSNPTSRTNRKKWRPEQRLKIRFINLIKKYCNTLFNQDYMETAPLLFILSYYVVFQRILWLLYNHHGLDTEQFVRLATTINAGFFGQPNEGPPARSIRLHGHLQRKMAAAWLENEVPFYALASVMAISDRLAELNDKALVDAAVILSKRVLAAISTVFDFSSLNDDVDRQMQVATVYEQEPEFFLLAVEDLIKGNLPEIAAQLTKWSGEIAFNPHEFDDARITRMMYQANVDYRLAQYAIYEGMADSIRQMAVCEELIFWLRRNGERAAAKEWGERLVDMLIKRGADQETARALYHQGQELFYQRDYVTAEEKLNKAWLLAERLEDDKLVGRCQKLRDSVSYFLERSNL